MQTGPKNEKISITVRPRQFIERITLPYLPRLRLYDPACKPRGIERLKRKLGQAGDEFLHGWMHLPARGTFTVLMADGSSRDLVFDAHHSAYLAFISRALHGGYEPAETMFLEAMLAKADTFYDVGANWGHYSLLAATHPQFTGQIVALEISDQMNSALENMARTLALDTLKIVGYGLSDHAGNVAISADRATHLTRVIAGSAAQATGAVKAAVVCLDDVDLPAPDLMKIDVEDHEIEVLRGGTRVLNQHKPLILFESRHGSKGGEAGEFLRAHGYGLYRLHRPAGADATVELTPINLVAPSPQDVNFVAVPIGQEARWFD